MLLCRVLAKVVCPRQDPKLAGQQLKLLQVLNGSLEPRDEYYVAADPLGAAEGQLVFTASGACARKALGLDGRPVDLAIVGVVERIDGGDALRYRQ